jgi:hypothetical protein
MAEFTITAVNPETKTWSGGKGTFVDYQVRFEGNPNVVKITQKPETRPPQVGDVVTGSVDMSAPYGPKFKKEFSQGGGGGGYRANPATSDAPRSTGKEFDTFSMYLSYAKDIAITEQMFDAKGGFNEELYASVLDSVITGGKTLYDGRPGAGGSDASQEDKTPDSDWDGDKVDMSEVDKLFPDSSKSSDDQKEIPFE